MKVVIVSCMAALLTGCSAVAPTDPKEPDCFIFVTDFDGTKRCLEDRNNIELPNGGTR